SPTAPLPVATRVAGSDGMAQVYVPAGSFLMGAVEGDPDAGADEMSQRQVYLDAFWIDLTEVTNGMYALCVGAGACNPPLGSGSKTRPIYYGDERFVNYPVIYVSWQDAEHYCRWAGRRLPSEAEWEKAARGVDGRVFPWAEALVASSRLANFNNQVGDTTLVGMYPLGASPYGALDIAGNVAEWVADWYGEDYYALAPLRNPLGPDSGEYRVLRGGSWLSLPRAVRVTFRLWNYPDLRFEGGGFRCASDQ
ncbi:MAG: SUMF1/EgtB/PvdO family nonheme iron enzyme, partial [Anaerolineales bacterium]|nr:SUMF1/EgtB/PvdO family nonheme iron enzyme [Anaerolineales bacterium]